MKKIFHYFALRFGRRPALLCWALLVLSGLLCFRLVLFVSETDGLRLFGISSRQASWWMAALIFTVLAALGWRLAAVNQSMRKLVVEKYREALHWGDAENEKKIRGFVAEIGIRGNLFQRLHKLIRLTPEPFFALLFFLSVANTLLYICLKIFRFWLRHHDPESFWADIFFPNCPWAIATFTFVFLIIHDIWILEQLENRLLALPGGPNFIRHFQHFREKLTASEFRVLKLWMLENLSQKEIATQTAVSQSTIKTHKNNLNHKWAAYQKENRFPVALKTMCSLPQVKAALEVEKTEAA